MEEVTQCSRNILDSHHPEHCISFSISSFIMRLSLIAFKYLLVCLLSGRMLESEWPEWWKRKAMWEGWTTVIFFWDFTHLDHWLGCSLKETKNCKWILAALGKYIEYFSVYFLSIRENKSPWKKNKTPDTAAFIICRNSDESEFAIWFPGCEVRFLGDGEKFGQLFWYS